MEVISGCVFSKWQIYDDYKVAMGTRRTTCSVYEGYNIRRRLPVCAAHANLSSTAKFECVHCALNSLCRLLLSLDFSQFHVFKWHIEPVRAPNGKLYLLLEHSGPVSEH